MEKLKLFLADDHQILIDGLIAFFREEKNIEVVGTANDGTAVLHSLHAAQPHIVLLDLNMPKMDGFNTLERLKKEHPKIQVIILSNYQQTQLMKEAEEKGAAGYVVKNGSKEELLEAIEKVKNGEKYFSPAEQPVTQKEFYTDAFMKKHQLTKREIDIIKLVCEEMNSHDIGNKLFISEFTVNTHRRNIMRKLNVKNGAGIINFARQHGIC
jgi:DNA-binding NarL/FixJ family response regulator